MTDARAPEIEFLYDFGSPNAYLAHRVLPGVAARTGARLRYVPVLLGGIFKASGNQSPFSAYAGVKGKLDYELLEMRRFMADHDLGDFHIPPTFPLNSLLMMRAAAALKEDPQYGAYVDAAFHAVWEDDKQMDDPAVFAAVASEAGIDGQALVARAQQQAVKDVLRADTDAALARGVFGAPTYFVGGEMYFGKERMPQIEAQLRRITAAPTTV